MEDNFPAQLQDLPGRLLKRPADFFELLIDIHRLDPVENPVLACKERFERLCEGPVRRASFKQKRAEKDREELEKILGKKDQRGFF